MIRFVAENITKHTKQVSHKDSFTAFLTYNDICSCSLDERIFDLDATLAESFSTEENLVGLSFVMFDNLTILYRTVSLHLELGTL